MKPSAHPVATLRALKYVTCDSFTPDDRLTKGRSLAAQTAHECSIFFLYFVSTPSRAQRALPINTIARDLCVKKHCFKLIKRAARTTNTFPMKSTVVATRTTKKIGYCSDPNYNFLLKKSKFTLARSARSDTHTVSKKRVGLMMSFFKLSLLYLRSE